MIKPVVEDVEFEVGQQRPDVFHGFELLKLVRMDVDHEPLEAAEVVGVVKHIAHETLVNLEQFHRQMFQVSQRGITGAEIIQGEHYPDLPARLDDPGYAGQKMLPGAYERVRILKENIGYRKPGTKIEVDGNIDVHNAALLSKAGAEIFVLGSSSIFKGNDLGQSLRDFRQAVAKEQERI